MVYVMGMGFENIYLHLICVHVNKFKIDLFEIHI